MQTTAESAFDRIASAYDGLWTNTPVGTSQRLAVWKRIDPLFRPGQSILDIGCGDGADALHLQLKGVSVYGIDASANMVGIAQARGIRASHLSIEELDQLPESFDGALSNFGALNCVSSLEQVAAALAQRVRTGGFVALCFINSFCIWESCYYFLRGQFRRAFRRLRPQVRSSLGIDIFYFSRRAILSAFHRDFRLHGTYGIGLFVPPSYVTELGRRAVERLSILDKYCAHWPFFCRLSDHYLCVFERI
jgi:2-polyprenyl-3-methyl-5-hydroxy-6-metoxy-1,4-benzoquinol methylase